MKAVPYASGSLPIGLISEAAYRKLTARRWPQFRKKDAKYAMKRKNLGLNVGKATCLDELQLAIESALVVTKKPGMPHIDLNII